MSVTWYANNSISDVKTVTLLGLLIIRRSFLTVLKMKTELLPNVGTDEAVGGAASTNISNNMRKLAKTLIAAIRYDYSLHFQVSHRHLIKFATDCFRK